MLVRPSGTEPVARLYVEAPDGATLDALRDAALRHFFEVDAKHIAHAALRALADEGELKPAAMESAQRRLGIDPEKPDPLYS